MYKCIYIYIYMYICSCICPQFRVQSAVCQTARNSVQSHFRARVSVLVCVCMCVRQRVRKKETECIHMCSGVLGRQLSCCVCIYAHTRGTHTSRCKSTCTLYLHSAYHINTPCVTSAHTLSCMLAPSCVCVQIECDTQSVTHKRARAYTIERARE